MTASPDRLPADPAHAFAGAEIDRDRPLRFRLNGVEIDGFAGDTVLSAALAAGIVSAGRRAGSPLALDERCAPAVAPPSLAHAADHVVPMARMPAVDGADFVTLPAPPAGVRRHLPGGMAGGGATLGLVLDGPELAAPAWAELKPSAELTAELCVIGGGIAGLSAAVAAGRVGITVVLVERRLWLGGDARFFGHIEGETSAELMLAQLRAALATLDNVRMLLGTEALSVGEGRVRVHRIRDESDRPTSEVLEITAPRLVLATGTLERLPVFPGNRLPGVALSAAAFHRAERYGVWHGGTALVNAGSSIAYRLATRAGDAGVVFARLADVRAQPQSRFIEFSKAYGITLARDVSPLAADWRARTPLEPPMLEVKLVEAVGAARKETVHRTELLILSGGWQPDLQLWLLAGGGCRWSEARHELVATGSPEGVALAGSAAGLQTLSGCAASGEAAAARLFGRPAPVIADRLIDPLYETPDAPTTIAPVVPGARHPAWLDAGTSLNHRPAPRRSDRLARLVFRRAGAPDPLGGAARAMSLGEIAAAVQCGLVAEAEAGDIAAERCVIGLPPVPPEPSRAVPVIGEQTGPEVPDWLVGRFGPDAELRSIVAADRRSLETGTLLYADSDTASPLEAVGVVLGPAAERGKARALVAALAGEAGTTLIARGVGSAVSVRLERREQAEGEPRPPHPAGAD